MSGAMFTVTVAYARAHVEHARRSRQYRVCGTCKPDPFAVEVPA